MELELAVAFARPRHQGVLTTIRKDSRPQISNIAYAALDDLIRVSVTDTRAKTRNLRRDPRASLYVPGDDFWTFVVLEGEVEVSPVATDPGDAVVDELVEVYRAISGEHPDWADFRRAMVDDRRLVLRFGANHAYGSLR
jgi:PPOX class probable F420-dependent enzyme